MKFRERTPMAELKKVKASMMNAVHDLPLLVARDEGFFRDEGLDVDILVTPGSGQHNSDDRALKDDIFNRGTQRQRMEAVMSGKVKAASLQEPWISVAEAKGGRVIIESHSTRSEAAGDEMDGPTLAKMFRAEARAAEAIQKHPEKFAHYVLEEAGGLIERKDLKLARIL